MKTAPRNISKIGPFAWGVHRASGGWAIKRTRVRRTPEDPGKANMRVGIVRWQRPLGLNPRL